MNKRGEVVSGFSVENFLSHSAETFRKGIFQCFSKFGCRKSLWIRGGGGSIKIFLRFFCLTVPKNSIGESFSLSLISGIEKC